MHFRIKNSRNRRRKVKKLILTIMGVVSILLSFNVNAKMSEGDYVTSAFCSAGVRGFGAR
jgi:hypothetical protein